MLRENIKSLFYGVAHSLTLLTCDPRIFVYAVYVFYGNKLKMNFDYRIVDRLLCSKYKIQGRRKKRKLKNLLTGKVLSNQLKNSCNFVIYFFFCYLIIAYYT